MEPNDGMRILIAWISGIHLRPSMVSTIMAKRRGNPNWGKSEPLSLLPSMNSFDLLVHSLGLSPDQYVCSTALRDWVLKNKDHKYVPQELLQAYGFAH